MAKRNFKYTNNIKLYQKWRYKQRQISKLATRIGSKRFITKFIGLLGQLRAKGIEEQAYQNYKNLLRLQKDAGIRVNMSKDLIRQRFFDKGLKERIENVNKELENIGFLNKNGRLKNKKILDFISAIEGIIVGDEKYYIGSDEIEDLNPEKDFEIYLRKAREIYGLEKTEQFSIEKLQKIYNNKDKVLANFKWKKEHDKFANKNIVSYLVELMKEM